MTKEIIKTANKKKTNDVKPNVVVAPTGKSLNKKSGCC